MNLKMRQLYGVNPKVKPSVLAIDDSQIVYVCGHNTVLYNTENKAYRFIQGEYFQISNHFRLKTRYINNRQDILSWRIR